jgi:hypothetical protein
MNHTEQLACAQRELAMRKRVFPRWVQQEKMTQEKMTQEKADHEIACMEAIVATLKPLASQEGGQLQLI